MTLTEEERNLLKKYGKHIAQRVRKFNFIPPLQFEDATSYVYEKLCNKIKAYKSLYIFEKYINRNIKLFVYDYYKIARKEPIDINENISNESTTLEEDFWIDKRDYAIACEINELKTYNRNILLLYFYDGLSEIEIARLLGVSQPTISNHLHKALDTIKPKINKRLTELEKIRSSL